ncbi:MAG: hypothetical protein JXR61_09180 [Prolixibacteraceae bacterium]|nr:hypothetical protein [Prolixibacteraceae bacterium]
MKELFITFLLLCLCTACLKEPVDISIFMSGNTNEYVVIEGFASTYFGNQYLKITKSAGIQAVITKPVLDADVVVYSNDKLIQYHLHDTSGVYCSNVPFAIERGTNYTCKVLVDAMEYKASDALPLNNNLQDTLLPMPKQEDVRQQSNGTTFSIENHHFGYERTSFYLLGPRGGDDYFETNDAGYYAFSYNMSYIYKHQGSLPQGLYAYGSGSFSSIFPNNTFITYFSFDISDAYENFLNEFMNITDWSDGIFATVPGNPISNVSEGGTGYFYVTDLKRIKLDYQDFVEMIKE